MRLALDGFITMEEMYKHPDRIPEIQRKANKQQMKRDFWNVYAQGEMLDIFSGKKMRFFCSIACMSYCKG
jgi:hypothetical protein